MYGYEEALGYCVDPDGVRDKDGISAALLVAELAATLKADGRSFADELDAWPPSTAGTPRSSCRSASTTSSRSRE